MRVNFSELKGQKNGCSNEYAFLCFYSAKNFCGLMIYLLINYILLILFRS